ncbi:MAG: hypothetical protein ACO3T1_07960, partial [Ilumatobacteraceae bacterium]
MARESLGLRRTALSVVVPVLALLAVVLPDLVNPYRLFLATLIVIFAVAGTGLVVIMGWTGQIALAHVSFLGIGVYVTNWLFSDVGVPWPIALVLAAFLASFIGFLIG